MQLSSTAHFSSLRANAEGLRPILLFFLLPFYFLLLPDSVNAQITPDGSLGNESSKLTPSINIKGLSADRIDGGATRGANLFHSFSEFNIGDTQRVYFANPTGVENILTRVTGGKISNILGTLGVDGTANLFLLNPSGIVFGKNAQLDVGGSFVGSTANGIVFGDRGFFNATNPQVPSQLLTIKPSALFFNQLQTGKIASNSIAPLGNNMFGLKVPDGRSLVLVGGDIAINGDTEKGGLYALGGRVELAGVAGNGTVGLNIDRNNLSLDFPDDVKRADISLDNRVDVNVRAAFGGSIVINAENFSINGRSRIRSGINTRLGSVDNKAGDIEINSTGVIKITNGSFLSNTAVFGAGNSGDINLTTNSLFLENNSFLASSTLTDGDAGNIRITANDTISVKSNSFLASNTFFGQGNAGEITLNAGNLILFDNMGNTNQPRAGAFTNVETEFSTGNGGDINITTGVLSVNNGARLFASTLGQGNAGSININARDTVSFQSADIFSDVGKDAKGLGGDINITTGSLFVTDGARLSTNIEGLGIAGNININAGDIVSFHSGRAFSDIQNGAEGLGGDINIKTGSLFVTDGAQLITATRGKGDSGSLNINANDTIFFAGVDSDGFSSGAFSAVGEGAVGNGNGINIITNSLVLSDGGQLNASTFGEGKAGSINITANSLEIKHGAQLRNVTSGKFDAGNITLNIQDNITLSGSDTGIFANTRENSTGKGGNIIIDPQTVTIRDGAKIAVDSQGTGIGGSIQLAAGLLELDNGTISAATLSNKGGDINLILDNLLLIRNGSQITTTAGSDRFGGDGGNITINAPGGFIVAVPQENSDITANAFTGRGGRIDITTSGIFGIQSRPRLTQLSDITASSALGVSGEVTINSPDVDPSRGLSELPENIVDAAGLINQNLCTAARQGSEFIVTGRGGLPIAPSELLNPLVTWEDWSMGVQQESSQPKPPKTNHQLQNKGQSSNAIVEAQGWILDGQGNVILTAKPVKVTPGGTWLHPLDCQRLISSQLGD